jgi:DNA-binding MarR family transcriptional regulator
VAVETPVRRVVRFLTGDFTDPGLAASAMDRELPPTAFAAPNTAVLDLRGKLLSPSALHEIVVTLGQRLRGGAYGQLRVVVVSSDAATRELIALLADKHELPIFVASSTDSGAVESAVPVGNLTTAEEETLAELRGAGWSSTVSALATHMGIEPTAANNRLVNLEKKGYIYRVRRGRRQGDLFVDPRSPMDAPSVGHHKDDVAPLHSVLRAHGINAKPYDRPSAPLEGEAAERAAEILRRHGKL